MKKALVVFLISAFTQVSHGGVGSFIGGAVGGFILGRGTSKPNNTYIQINYEGPTEEEITRGVYRALKIYHLELEAERQQQVLEGNITRYDQTRERINKDLRKLAAGVAEGTIICSGFCGGFDSKSAELQMRAVYSYGSNEEAVFNNLLSQCSSALLFREMKDTRNDDGKPFQLLIKAKAKTVCDAVKTERPSVVPPPKKEGGGDTASR